MRKEVIFLFAIIIIALTGCGKKDHFAIIVDNQNIDMYVTEIIELPFTIKNNDKVVEKDVLLTVNDPTVLEINNNKITALKEGTTSVTIKFKDDPNISTTVNITVNKSLIITYPTNIIYARQEMTLTFEDKADKDNQGITWLSSDSKVATVNNGVIKGIKPGNVTITAKSNTNDIEEVLDFVVKEVSIENIEIDAIDDVDALSLLKLNYSVNPAIALQEVIWTSSDENIATVDKDGNVKTFKEGEVTITATAVADNTKTATVTFKVNIDPIKILTTMNVEKPIRQYVTTYGATEKQQWVYGSVSKYFNADMNLKEQFVPLNQNKYTGTIANKTTILDAENQKAVRSGILHPETKLIIFHDTGNNNVGANAKMHGTYMVSTGNERARSWHYTVDENEIIHHIPDNEVTWQGDHFDAYAYGIGIETCVDFDSDLYTTWHRTAKLMASLLLKHNLTVKDIKQHHDFPILTDTGATWYKDCPRTLRHANLYDNAISLVEAEYYILTLLDGYDISFKSLNPTYVDDRGRIIKVPNTATRIGYIVNITKGTYNESVVLYSTLPGEDETTEVTLNGSSADFAAAKQVDLQIAELPTTITKNDSTKVNQARAAYDSLTQVQKDLVTTLELLISKELQLHKLDAVNTNVIINQVLISDNGITKYGYIELYNTTNADISLKDWTIQYAKENDTFSIDNAKLNQVWYKFNDTDTIKANSYFLIQVKEGNSVGNHFLPLPDSITNIYLDSNGKLALTNSSEVVTAVNNSHIVDFVGFGNVNLYEGNNSYKGSLNNLALIRRELVDTNNNEKDFVSVYPNPINSLNEKINPNATDSQKKAMAVDILILSLPYKVVLTDENQVIQARAAYDALTETEKKLVVKLDLLIAKEKDILGLKDPDLIPLYETVDLIPKHIINDYNFPIIAGVTINYKEGQDSSCFNLTTGKLLKTTYEYKPVILVAKHKQSSLEFTVNFGLLQAGQQAVFSTGTKAPAVGGQTKDGKGTYNEQLSTSGFGGVAIAYNNKIYFIGKNAFIPLNKPATGNTLTQVQLKPHGSSATTPWFNESLVNGVPTGYAGTGVLYYNASDIDLKFDPSYTYGRNNSGNYGYAKIVFSPNNDGTYIVNKPWDNSGANDSTNGTTQTLKSGEYLFCPHTYETNLNGGTWLMVGGVEGTTGIGVLNEGSILSIMKYKYKFE